MCRFIGTLSGTSLNVRGGGGGFFVFFFFSFFGLLLLYFFSVLRFPPAPPPPHPTSIEYWLLSVNGLEISVILTVCVWLRYGISFFFFFFFSFFFFFVLHR